MNFQLEYLKLDFCILFLILSGEFNGYYFFYPLIRLDHSFIARHAVKVIRTEITKRLCFVKGHWIKPDYIVKRFKSFTSLT